MYLLAMSRIKSSTIAEARWEIKPFLEQTEAAPCEQMGNTYWLKKKIFDPCYNE